MSVTINGTTGIDLIQDGAVSSAAKLATGVVTDAKLNLTADSQEIKDALNATGTAPIYACRAWVNFNGTNTVAIRASGNVSSITDNGVGNYTVNFMTAMPDTNYSWAGSVSADGNSGAGAIISHGPNVTYPIIKTITTLRVIVQSDAVPVTDVSEVSVAIFR